MESGEVRKVVKDILDLLDEHVFISRSVKELLWGYQDALLTASQKIDPEWFYTDIIGYFINKNDTDDGIYTIYTGEKDISLLGVIDKYNGSSVLPFWTTYYANMINGTDGSLSPPYIDKSRTMYSFASDVCRSVAGVYSEDSLTPQGIDVWRFTAPLNYLQNASINPDNLGFCTPQNNCLGQGLINVSNCQLVDFFHIPAVISFPHFYLADKKYLDAVVGLNPNEAEHQTIVDVEPYTGLVLQAAKRLQVNLHLQPIANITETEHITEVFLPIFWLNESAVIDDENADKMISMLFTPLKIIWVLEITLISVGLLVALVSAMYCAFNRHLVLRSSATSRQLKVEPSFNEDPGTDYDHMGQNERTPLINYDVTDQSYSS
ncbi:hypothetical protein ACJMK2_009349 [Sinanodonta woodiana]|uniref:Uncharacterized protein n=1 Tax=Sinanodonta woodiana TaxID=1069815 RepID=A0ABD3VEY8_SINWO